MSAYRASGFRVKVFSAYEMSGFGGLGALDLGFRIGIRAQDGGFPIDRFGGMFVSIAEQEPSILLRSC